MFNRFTDMGIGIPKGGGDNEVAITSTFTAYDDISAKDLVYFQGGKVTKSPISVSNSVQYTNAINSYHSDIVHISEKKAIAFSCGSTVSNIYCNSVSYTDDLVLTKGTDYYISSSMGNENDAFAACKVDDGKAIIFYGTTLRARIAYETGDITLGLGDICVTSRSSIHKIFDAFIINDSDPANIYVGVITTNTSYWCILEVFKVDSATNTVTYIDYKVLESDGRAYYCSGNNLEKNKIFVTYTRTQTGYNLLRYRVVTFDDIITNDSNIYFHQEGLYNIPTKLDPFYVSSTKLSKRRVAIAFRHNANYGIDPVTALTNESHMDVVIVDINGNIPSCDGNHTTMYSEDSKVTQTDVIGISENLFAVVGAYGYDYNNYSTSLYGHGSTQIFICKIKENNKTKVIGNYSFTGHASYTNVSLDYDNNYLIVSYADYGADTTVNVIELPIKAGIAMADATAGQSVEILLSGASDTFSNVLLGKNYGGIAYGLDPTTIHVKPFYERM